MREKRGARANISCAKTQCASEHLVRGARKTRCAREHLVRGARRTRCALGLPELLVASGDRLDNDRAGGESFSSVGDCYPPLSKVCYNPPPSEAVDSPTELLHPELSLYIPAHTGRTDERASFVLLFNTLRVKQRALKNLSVLAEYYFFYCEYEWSYSSVHPVLQDTLYPLPDQKTILGSKIHRVTFLYIIRLAEFVKLLNRHIGPRII